MDNRKAPDTAYHMQGKNIRVLSHCRNSLRHYYRAGNFLRPVTMPENHFGLSGMGNFMFRSFCDSTANFHLSDVLASS